MIKDVQIALTYEEDNKTSSKYPESLTATMKRYQRSNSWLCISKQKHAGAVGWINKVMFQNLSKAIEQNYLD